MLVSPLVSLASPRTMSTNKFTTRDEIVIEHFVEEVTLLQIRHWRESPGVNRCEAWFQSVGRVEQLWHSVPLGVQGRAGHRYRLCWARAADAKQYSLVGAQNLATKRHALSCSTGLAPSLFVPSRYGRSGFLLGCAAATAFAVVGQSMPDAFFRAVLAGVTWWQVASVPIALGIVGACASVWQNRRDVSRSFDKFVEEVLSDESAAN